VLHLPILAHAPAHNSWRTAVRPSTTATDPARTPAVTHLVLVCIPTRAHDCQILAFRPSTAAAGPARAPAGASPVCASARVASSWKEKHVQPSVLLALQCLSILLPGPPPPPVRLHSCHPRQFVVEEEARARVARGTACPLQSGPTPAPTPVEGHGAGGVVEAEVGALLATAHVALPSAEGPHGVVGGGRRARPGQSRWRRGRPGTRRRSGGRRAGRSARWPAPGTPPAGRPPRSRWSSVQPSPPPYLKFRSGDSRLALLDRHTTQSDNQQ
jgi:hypothetical protein